MGGGARDALGAVADVEPLVGRHPRDDGPKGQRLPEAGHDVVEIDERPHLTEVRPLAEAEHHAGEGAGEDDDQERAIADVVQAVDEGARLERRRDHREQRQPEEAAETTEGLDELDRPPPDGLEGADDGWDGWLSHRGRAGTPREPSGGNISRRGGTAT